MGKRTVTICDHTFLEHTKSASIGGDNLGVGPKYFEWEYANAQSARFVTDGDIKDARGEGQVAWLLEPYALHQENYYRAMGKKFDAVLAHSKCGWMGAKFYPYGGSWIAFDRWGVHEKTKDVSLILSDKDTLPGHKLRHRAAEILKDKVDIFHHFPSKFEALAPYRYSIVIESVKNSWYFTEKLVDCLSVGTTPIYWGTPEVCKFFDEDGIIPVDSVAEIEKFVYMARTYGRESFEERRSVAEKNVELCRDWAVCEDNIYAMYPELFE